MKITPCPTKEEIEKAFEVLGNQELHYYQVLYEYRLTSPLGFPFTVGRAFSNDNGMTKMLRPIQIYHRDHKELGFYVGNKSDDEILELVRMINKNLNRQKISPRACCGLAVREECVCNESFSCPLHGSTCYGSHD